MIMINKQFPFFCNIHVLLWISKIICINIILEINIVIVLDRIIYLQKHFQIMLPKGPSLLSINVSHFRHVHWNDSIKFLEEDFVYSFTALFLFVYFGKKYDHQKNFWFLLVSFQNSSCINLQSWLFKLQNNSEIYFKWVPVYYNRAAHKSTRILSY